MDCNLNNCDMCQIATILGVDFIKIPKGLAFLGAVENDKLARLNEFKQHIQEIESFWISRYPITQSQFIKIMGYNPSYYSSKSVYIGKNSTGNFPVECVAWNEALKFCNCFKTLAKIDYVTRLPYESEWEYACRGNKDYIFQNGNVMDSTQANIQGNYPFNTNLIGSTLNRTCEVGLYEPNQFGLYDMHGNIWEWCMDEYKSPSGIIYPNARVLKGGAWNCYSRFCRTSYRGINEAYKRYFDTGFRIVISNHR